MHTLGVGRGSEPDEHSSGKYHIGGALGASVGGLEIGAREGDDGPGAGTGGGRARRCRADPSSCCGCTRHLHRAAQELRGGVCDRLHARLMHQQAPWRRTHTWPAVVSWASKLTAHRDRAGGARSGLAPGKLEHEGDGEQEVKGAEEKCVVANGYSDGVGGGLGGGDEDA